MDDCIFCKIVKGEIPCHKIGENDDFICFLDIKPISEGHALIVPKQHFTDVTEFPKDLDVSFFSFVQEMSKKIVDAVGADGFNLGMNTGKAAGQVVFHQHTHVIPRFEGDGFATWPHQDKTNEELEEIKKKILGN
jgi:histidine triad (HIT) family protein